MNGQKQLAIILSLFTVVSCTNTGLDGPNRYDPSQFDGTQIYPDPYENINIRDYSSKKEVIVPETYHMSALQSPVPHTDRDKAWVQAQNPTQYTIELANSNNPAHVASALHKAPKNERMAEIRYQQAGKTYFKGVYGSFSSREEAEAMLNNLPVELKNNAQIQSWQHVQNALE